MKIVCGHFVFARRNDKKCGGVETIYAWLSVEDYRWLFEQFKDGNPLDPLRPVRDFKDVKTGLPVRINLDDVSAITCVPEVESE